MSIIRSMRRQKAVYWQQDSKDQYGAISYKAPVEVACRWDGGSEEMIDSEGRSFRFSDTVYPDRAMEIGDMLKEGELDSNTPDDPRDDEKAKPVQRVARNPNFQATEFLHTAYL